MAQSFTRRSASRKAKAIRRRVLITGAAGRIGAYLARHIFREHELRLMVRGDERNIGRLGKYGEVVEAQLADLDRLKEICGKIDTVVHLAANPDAMGTWNELYEPNILGVYNMMVAAKFAGCRRVVFASSVHAISGYPVDVQAKSSDPVNPGDLYGVTKCFGEAMGRYMAEREGLSVIALRIGAVQPRAMARTEGSLGMMEQWVSYEDLTQLIRLCVDDETLVWGLFNALSDNRFKKMDISDARELLGYKPVDDTSKAHPKLKSLELRKNVRAGNATDPDYRSGLRDDLTKR